MILFLRTTLASVLGILLGLGVLFLVFAAQLAKDVPPRIPESCVLVLDETLVTTESGSTAGLVPFLAGQESSSLPLHQVIAGIDAATEDARIEAILLLGGELHGLTAYKEMQAALLRFRAAGKQIFAYASDYDQSGYYLASVADPVVMQPLGTFVMSGFAAEMQFYAEVMEELGVEMQVTRVGKYKSAVEPFLLSEASPANREQMQTLLTDLQVDYLRDVATARGLEVTALEQFLQEGGLATSEQAEAAGLVDEVAYFDEVLDQLQELVGVGPDEEPFAQVGIHRYLNEMEAPEESASGPTIAVVIAEGEIVDGWDETAIGGNSLGELLRSVRLDPSIDGVVLRVNSPGGSASASEVILREMQLLQEAGKPVVASMGPVAASGGYWISCQADAIVAQPSTITGSIGVFGMFPNIEGLMDKVGVHVDTIKTGPYADLMSIYHRKSPEELALVQGYVDAIYEGFLDRVTAGRPLERAALMEIAQGRVWSGSRALELGLVDALGGLDAAIELCATELDAESWRVDWLEEELSGLDVLLKDLTAPEDYPVLDLGMPEALQPVLRGWRNWNRYAEQPGVYARLPYELRIR